MNGVLMAAEEINEAGGINGRKLDVVIEDDKGKPELAAASISKLVQRDQVIAVIAGGTSNNSRAAAPEAQAAKVPLIAPSSTDPQVTQVGDYIFRTCFIDAFQGYVMAKFAVNTLNAKKAGILLDFNSSYSRGLADFFELSFTRLGGQVVSKQLYTAGDRDYRGQLNTLRGAAPDVIFIPGYYEDVALMAKQARQLSITQALLGADGWDAPELWERGGDALNGSYISSHYSAEDQSPLVQTFVKEIQAALWQSTARRSRRARL
jgi:branched-chain amino acid transport system substrate-binding protein